jgi:hypothetical protein
MKHILLNMLLFGHTVIAWSDNPVELKQLKNDTGSALALMECKPRHNTTDVATLWAGMPGNAGFSE